jgi:hypothetical protein
VSNSPLPEHLPTAEQDARGHAKDQMIATLQALVSSLTAEVTSLRRAKKKETAKLATPGEETLIAEVFADWKLALGWQDAELIPERHAPLLARIRDGFVRKDFQKVWAFAKGDAFLAGDNKRNMRYDDIVKLCRDRARFEGYMSKPRKQSSKQAFDCRDSTPKLQSEVRGYRL